MYGEKDALEFMRRWRCIDLRKSKDIRLMSDSRVIFDPGKFRVKLSLENSLSDSLAGDLDALAGP